MSVAFPVEADSRWREHTATAGQTVFPVTYPFQDNADITVVRIALDGTKTILSEPADYVLTGADNPAGGSYTLTAPAAEGEVYRSIGSAVLDRVLSVVRNGRFKSGPIDADLDRALIRDQELARDAARAVKADFGEEGPVLPPWQENALLGWNGDGENKELVNRQDVGQSVVDAQEAADRAEAAAANIDYLTVPDRTALAAVDTDDHTAALSREDGAGGQFFWSLSDFSGEVSNDPRQIRYVPPSSDLSGASGVWIWVKQNRLNIRRAGVLVDGEADTTGENRARFNDAIKWAAQEGMILFLDGGECRTKGGIYLRSNSFIEGKPGFKLIPTDWSGTSGAIITNVRSGEAGTSDISNVRITGLNSDGSELPYDGAGNDNAYGFAWNARDVLIQGGIIENYQATHNDPIAGTGGGKGVQCEYGARDVIAEDLFIRNCFTALNANGAPGTLAGTPDGDLKSSIGIRYSNINVFNCDILIAALGTDPGAGSATGNPDVMELIVEGITARNVGFAPNRKGFTSSVKEKGAPIIVGNGQNTAIRNIDIVNETGYAAYSAISNPDLIGHGFATDCVGAIAIINGCNVDLENVRYWGQSDYGLMFKRARVAYDDAGNTSSGTPGQPGNNLRMHIRNVKHFGTINQHALAGDPYNAVLTPSNSNMTGEWELFCNAPTVGLVHSTLNGRANVVASLHNLQTRKILSGTLDQIVDDFNAFSVSGARRTEASSAVNVRHSSALWKSPTIADDGVFSWAVPNGVTQFKLEIHRGGSSAHGILRFVGNTWNVIQPAAAFIETSISVLTGTTGTDGKLTVSYNSGMIYVENRTGASGTWVIVPDYYD